MAWMSITGTMGAASRLCWATARRVQVDSGVRCPSRWRINTVWLPLTILVTGVQLRSLAEHHQINVTQVVTNGPEGDITYHFEVNDGVATFGAGAADPEDVRMQQEWSTAVAVATGELNAQEAFVTGRIRFYGDQQLLIDLQPVFAALDGVFAAVRERTQYE